jgi:hypothetical protein
MNREIEDGMGFAGLVPTAAERRADEAQARWLKVHALHTDGLRTRIRDLEAVLRTIQEMLASDSIEYDDMRHIDTMIRDALGSTASGEVNEKA